MKKAELDLYQLREVAQVWYTKWKYSRPVEPLEWEECKKDFLGKYFSRERSEAMVKEFINLKQGNMRVVEYSLKFSRLSRFSPSLVSNLRDDMSRFVTGVADLVKEDCHMAMLHDDMTLDRLMVYAQ